MRACKRRARGMATLPTICGGDHRRPVHHQRHPDPHAARAMGRAMGRRRLPCPTAPTGYSSAVDTNSYDWFMWRSGCARFGLTRSGAAVPAQQNQCALYAVPPQPAPAAAGLLSIAAAEEITRDGCAARCTIGARASRSRG